jgi:hypothetical protein
MKKFFYIISVAFLFASCYPINKIIKFTKVPDAVYANQNLKDFVDKLIKTLEELGKKTTTTQTQTEISSVNFN